MTLLPASYLSRLHAHAVAGARNDLTDLLELREHIRDDEAEGGRLAVQFKREAAAALMVGRWSVERSLWIMRDYTKEQLEGWQTEGFCFSHVETANRIAPLSQYDSPVDLINAAIEAGNEEGKPMTVSEFTCFALGHREMQSKESRLIGLHQSYLKLFQKVAGLLDWDDDKRAGFEREFKTLWERWTK